MVELLEGLQQGVIRTIRDWITAPRDGTEFKAQFSDGTNARVRRNSKANQWQVQRQSGRWVSMRYEHGTHDPVGWW